MQASVVDRSHRLFPHLTVLHSYLRLLLGMQGLPGESFEVALVAGGCWASLLFMYTVEVTNLAPTER